MSEPVTECYSGSEKAFCYQAPKLGYYRRARLEANSSGSMAAAKHRGLSKWSLWAHARPNPDSHKVIVEMTPDSLGTLDRLCSSTRGGIVTLNIESQFAVKAKARYRAAIARLDEFGFWRRGEGAPYRPVKGLWLPQRRAVAFAHGYLSAIRGSAHAKEAALIKMPTGTGKTAVIAALACGSPLVSKTLILTPRAALVRQMKFDLSYRFWKKLDAIYYDCKLHEDVAADEIDTKKQDIRRGVLAPVRTLSADQYKQIYEERDLPRQILVSTFNALHLNLGLTPPAHRSMFGREAREVAYSIRHLDDDEEEDIDSDAAKENVQAFRNLLSAIDLVIVDEGHYEPAYSWAQAVRAIGAPTIIFTATPYRNDYKYFQIDGNYVFNLPWQEAVDNELIRAVRCAPAVGITSPKHQAGAGAAQPATKRRRYTEKDFVAEFAATLARLPKGKKVIVHAATFQSLKRLQSAFYSQGEAAVLIHDAFSGAEKDCLDLTRRPKKEREALSALRFQHVRHTEDHAGAEMARIWMHQYKLLEGIDDDRFVEIWLYDGFGTARQLVQQIGRAIRRPDLKDAHGQMATIYGSAKPLDVYDGAPTVAEQIETRWTDYLAYETYAAKNPKIAFIAETQLLAAVKRTAPAVQYIAGEFRGGHILDETPTMSAFQLPRRGVVCRVDGLVRHERNVISDSFLDELQNKSLEAMQIEERFDIKAVAAPEGAIYRDARLIRYLAWNDSPLLARHHLPEWRLGVMAIVRAGRYIFLLDTEGICIDTTRLKLLSPEPLELKRLFPKVASGPRSAQIGTRIVETAAAGLDISELGLRSISVHKHALDEGYFDLAEASQVPTWVRGFGQLGDRSARRRLSFRRSSVADATNKLLPVKDYIEWAQSIGDAMASETIEPHGYFNRFAREVPPLTHEAAVPGSVLLDPWDILDVASETRDERRWNSSAVDEIIAYDTCCEVKAIQEDENSSLRYFFRYGPYEVEIKYSYRATIPPAGRYTIESNSLDNALANQDPHQADREGDPEARMFGRRLSSSLTRLINQQQAFRIIPSVPDVIYSHSHFYQPEVNEALLSILEPCPALADVVSEKGDTRLTDPKLWQDKTLFGLVFGWPDGKGGQSEMARDIRSCEMLICDDRGQETADFYGISDQTKRILVIHAKAENATPGASARKLQDVTRQAQASLAFAGSGRQAFDFPLIWREPWEVVLAHGGGAKICKPRVFGPRAGKPERAYEHLMSALANPSYTKEIIMLTSGILSASAAMRAKQQADQRDLQFIYFLASVRSTFDRAGVRLRIIANP